MESVCFSLGSELMIESRAAIITLHSQGLVTQLKTAVSPNVNNDNTVLFVHLWLQLQHCSFHFSTNESDSSSFLILCAKRCRLSDLTLAPPEVLRFKAAGVNCAPVFVLKRNKAAHQHRQQQVLHRRSSNRVFTNRL